MAAAPRADTAAAGGDSAVRRPPRTAPRERHLAGRAARLPSLTSPPLPPRGSRAIKDGSRSARLLSRSLRAGTAQPHQHGSAPPDPAPQPLISPAPFECFAQTGLLGVALPAEGEENSPQGRREATAGQGPLPEAAEAGAPPGSAARSGCGRVAAAAVGRPLSSNSSARSREESGPRVPGMAGSPRAAEEHRGRTPHRELRPKRPLSPPLRYVPGRGRTEGRCWGCGVPFARLRGW